MSRDGHRQRLKKQFDFGEGANLPDHQLLELLLFYSIPRIDTKPIAYNLINRFGTLENVFKADKDALLDVEGVGENTVALIKLFNSIKIRNNENRNIKAKKISDAGMACKYAKNVLSEYAAERVIIITMRSNNEIIGCHTVSKGCASFSPVDTTELVKQTLNDNASKVIIAHNHPTGNTEPSGNDIEFTLSVISLLRKFNVTVLDHIIVGKDEALSMANVKEYKRYFK